MIQSFPRYKNDITRTGFTLIELLIVIAIIGILASVVMASLSGAKTRADDAKRVVQAQGVGRLIEMYEMDHLEYPLAAEIESGEIYPDNETLMAALSDAISEYGVLPPDFSANYTAATSYSGSVTAIHSDDGSCRVFPRGMALLSFAGGALGHSCIPNEDMFILCYGESFYENPCVH